MSASGPRAGAGRRIAATIGLAAGWVAAAVLAGVLWTRGPVTLTPPVGADPVQLLDPHYPPAVAGQQGYDYHEAVAADLDGDGVPETVHVVARVERTGQPPPNDFAWDDGAPWQVYVEAPGAGPVHLYARWVQLGRLRVWVAEGAAGTGAAQNLMIQEEAGAGFGLYRIRYQGPGQFAAEALAHLPVLDRAVPVRP